MPTFFFFLFLVFFLIAPATASTASLVVYRSLLYFALQQEWAIKERYEGGREARPVDQRHRTRVHILVRKIVGALSGGGRVRLGSVLRPAGKWRG